MPHYMYGDFDYDESDRGMASLGDDPAAGYASSDDYYASPEYATMTAAGNAAAAAIPRSTPAPRASVMPPAGIFGTIFSSAPAIIGAVRGTPKAAAPSRMGPIKPQTDYSKYILPAVAVVGIGIFALGMGRKK